MGGWTNGRTYTYEYDVYTNGKRTDFHIYILCCYTIEITVTICVNICSPILFIYRSINSSIHPFITPSICVNICSLSIILQSIYFPIHPSSKLCTHSVPHYEAQGPTKSRGMSRGPPRAGGCQGAHQEQGGVEGPNEA